LRAYIVVDLGFGDSGKGLLTDFLARQLGSKLVVRYNGGAQAGHNVVTLEGQQHTFSQFGSGTFVPGVKTFLSKYVVVHPGALLVEGDILVRKGIPNAYSRLRISDQALFITPFHQATNRIKEMARGQNRHGSCGVGVGETYEDWIAKPEGSILASDLTNPTLLRQKLGLIRERKRTQILDLYKDNSHDQKIIREWQIFEREDVIDNWVAMISRISDFGLVVPDTVLERWLHDSDNVIFEGAQGVLLDADAGFHPYTTWSNCTTANAREIIAQMAPDSQVSQIGVMRSHAVRHGPGPFPTETGELAGMISEHNQYNDWQGKVRYGWFDAVLARYALSITGNLDVLAVTHMDLLARLQDWKYCNGYIGPQELPEFVHSDASVGILTDFRLPGDLRLAQRERFTDILSTATPLIDTCSANEDEVIQKIENLLDHPVEYISNGPKAGNVKNR
jgi:adenylosuccinate synthase